MTALLSTLIDSRHRHVSGIYKISIGKYYYYGSSVDVYNRKYQHQNELRAQKHKNKFMQKVFNKYGNPIFEFVEPCEKSVLRKLEQIYLDNHYGKKHCLNFSNDSSYPRNYTYTAEVREKMSKALMGNKNGKNGKGVRHHMTIDGKLSLIKSNQRRFNKKVCIIKPCGEMLIFESRRDAASKLKVPEKTISRWACGTHVPTIAKHKDYIGWVFSTMRGD